MAEQPLTLSGSCSALTRYFQGLSGPILLVLDPRGAVKFSSDNINAVAELLRPAGGGASGMRLNGELEKAVRQARAAGGGTFRHTLSGGGGAGLASEWQITPLPLGSGPDADLAIALQQAANAPQIEETIQRLDRLASLGNLSASMAHEIKNALVAIRAFIDLLLERNPDAELAEVVRREIKRIDSLINRMLQFPGFGESEQKPVRLHDLLDHLLRLVQPQLKGHLIAVERRFDAARDTVVGDADALEQALLNLILNALEAMGDRGTLAVTTEVPAPGNGSGAGPGGDIIRVGISDTGPGIDPAHLPRLFEPFFTTKSSGTGLGLSITERIVLDHGGKIHIDSAPGRGAKFTIALPLVRS